MLASHLNIVELRVSQAKMLEVIKCEVKDFITSIHEMIEVETNLLKHRELDREVKNRSSAPL